MWHPIATVFGTEIAGNEKNNIDHPPQADATNGQELSDGCARMSEIETVHAEEAQKQWKQ